MDYGKVIMDNNTTNLVTRIGNIRMRTHESSERILDGEIGCSYKAANGKLKIMFKSSLIMKEKESNRIYNQRSGNVGERGPQELGRKGLLYENKIEGLDFCKHCLWKEAKSEVSKRRLQDKGCSQVRKGKGSAIIPSHGGLRYYITFIDYFNRKMWIYLLKIKDEAFKTLNNGRIKNMRTVVPQIGLAQSLKMGQTSNLRVNPESILARLKVTWTQSNRDWKT
ncbi:hypothetical protein CR513_17959, partial [Mucuna pruriens]